MRIRDQIMRAAQHIQFHTAGAPLHHIFLGLAAALLHWCYEELFNIFWKITSKKFGKLG